MKAMVKVKMEHSDNHKIIQLFKDVAQELLIKNDGYEGVIKSYENIELLAPVEEGDYVEVVGELVAFDYTKRTIEFEARKVVTHSDDINGIAGEYLVKPIVVCKAKAVCEVKK
ncbi:MAG: 3-aminobutyryl-CoA ammonia lyase [Peptostreptococcaceae bacterium]